MRPPMPKVSALVVSAIRNLRETRGSTSKDIMNYIMAEHRAGDAAVQRQLNASLKRGLEYGILRRVNGHYTLNGDPFNVNPYAMIPEDKSRRKRRRRRRAGRMRRGRRGRRARRGKKGGRRRTRKVAMKPQRRGTFGRNQEINARRVKRINHELNDKSANQMAPIERIRADHELAEHRPADVEIPRHASSLKDKERSRSRSRRSQSQPRQQTRQETPARSPSRSSASSDRDQDDNRQDE